MSVYHFLEHTKELKDTLGDHNSVEAAIKFYTQELSTLRGYVLLFGPMQHILTIVTILVTHEGQLVP
jgi:hypothetical protein